MYLNTCSKPSIVERRSGKRGRSYTFEWVHLYKGREGLTGIQLPQRLRGTLFPHPRNLAILPAATFPFLLQERTGALAPAVNCTPVIRSKAAVLSAPSQEMDARSLFRSNRSRVYTDGAFHLWWKSRRPLRNSSFLRCFESSTFSIYSKSSCTHQ